MMILPHKDAAHIVLCSLIVSRIDYCNAMLYGAPSYSVKKLHNNAARIVLEAPRRSHVSRLLSRLHCLPVQQRIEQRVALLTFKVRSTSTTSYLRRLIQGLHYVGLSLDGPFLCIAASCVTVHSIAAAVGVKAPLDVGGVA